MLPVDSPTEDGSDRVLAAFIATPVVATLISLTLGANLEAALVFASLAAMGLLAALSLYGDFRRKAPTRKRSLAALLAASFTLGVAAGAGALYMLSAIVIWSSRPDPAELTVAGAFGWALAAVIVGQAMPSQHDRLLKVLALGLAVLTTLALYLAYRR